MGEVDQTSLCSVEPGVPGSTLWNTIMSMNGLNSVPLDDVKEIIYETCDRTYTLITDVLHSLIQGNRKRGITEHESYIEPQTIVSPFALSNCRYTFARFDSRT